MKKKLQLLKGIEPLIVNSQRNIYIYNPDKREPKQMLNIINPSTKQHTKPMLNLIISKITHYIDEVMLHKLGLKVGICVLSGAKMKGSQQKWI